MVNTGEIFAHRRIGDIPMARVPLSDAEQAFLLEPGDLLFARQSLVLAGAGKCSIFMGAPEPVTYEGHIIRARPNKRVADPVFYFYYFNSAPGRRRIESITEQVAAAGIRGSDLAELAVPCPPLPVQHSIARILGALDDKIELNRKMNETLEQMARAIFKSWFVDFEPFRDNGMVDSPLGKIPKGWRVGTVGQLCGLARDGLLPADYPHEAFAHYSIPAYDDGREPKLERGADIKSNKLLVPEGAVLLSKLNPRFPRVWFANPGPGIRSICSTEFLACVPALAAAREFLYGLFTSDAFLTEFETRVTGTSSSHQRVRPEGLLDIEVVTPGKDCMERYAKAVGSLLQHEITNRVQARTHAAIRDALLPKLMSGEVEVGQVGRVGPVGQGGTRLNRTRRVEA